MVALKAPKSKKGTRKKRFTLLGDGKFALGVTFGSTVFLFFALFSDVFDWGVLDDTTLLGAIVGGVLAGGTALISSVLSGYYSLRDRYLEENNRSEAIALSIFTKIHSASDHIVKSYRHHFDGSEDNLVRYGPTGVLTKPLSFSRISASLSDEERAYTLARKNAELFNTVLDVDAIITSFNQLSELYEDRFNEFQEHIFMNNSFEISGARISGEVKINCLELLKVEDARNMLKSFLLRSNGRIKKMQQDFTDFIEAEFERKIEYSEDAEMRGSAENIYSGTHSS